jgi:hypothetical protein
MEVYVFAYEGGNIVKAVVISFSLSVVNRVLSLMTS